MSLAWNPINDWSANACKGVNLTTDQLTVALSNTAPGAETPVPTGDGDGVLANVTEVAYTFASTRNVTTVSWTNTGAVATLVTSDLTITATGGAVGPFRYIYLYDNTVAGDPLMGYWDHGSAVTVPDGSSYQLDFGASTWTHTVS